MEIPSGWENETVDSVCDQVSVGIVIRPSELYAEKGDIVRVFRSANVREGFIQDSDWKFIRRDAHDANSKSKLRTDDVLIVRTGYPGTACVVTPEYDDTNCIDIVFARPGERLRSDYLCAYTNSSEGRRQTLAKQGGLAQKHLNVGAYKKMRIPLPPIGEQRRIAEILGTWDQAIAATEALIAKSEAQKKALMQQLLTAKRRLPGFKGAWREVRLDEIFQFKKGQGLSKKAVVEDGLTPCVLYGELYTHYGDVIRAVKSCTNSNGGVPSKTGDVLIPASTTTTGIDLANATAVLEDGIRLSGDINILRPLETDTDPRFMARLLTYAETFKLARRAQGSTIVHLYGSHLKDIVISVPSHEEQVAISDAIDLTEGPVQALQGKLQTLKTEKAALMQQLLTGKRRVKLTEVAA